MESFFTSYCFPFLKRLSRHPRLALVGLLSVCMATLAEAKTAVSQLVMADPFIFVENGTYYCYGTRTDHGIEVFTSNDMKNWMRRGFALKRADSHGTRWFWAPEVYRFDDKYYMYYSAGERLYVAVGDSPLGPFKDAVDSMMMGDIRTIDSSVFTDDDGQQYIVFVESTNQNSIYIGKLNADHITIDKSTVHQIIKAQWKWEKHGYTCTEGPCIIKHDNIYYLMYSGSYYQNVDYAVGYATATDINGTWTKAPNQPFLKSGKGLYGTGHNGYFYDNAGTLRTVFHAYDAYEGSKGVGARKVYIGSLKFTNTDDLIMDPDSSYISPRVYMAPSKVDTLQTAYANGTSVAVDLDDDGRQELLLAGKNRDGNYSGCMLKYDADSKKWITEASPLAVNNDPAIIPCDINLDGNIDVVAFDAVGLTAEENIVAANAQREGIFLGDGTGNLTRADVSFVDTKGNATAFDLVKVESADVADFNYDGKPDIACVGYNADGTTVNVVLLNQGNLTFQVAKWNSTWHLYNAVVKAADFNNDGYTDFIVSGSVADRSGVYQMTTVYRNNPSNPGGKFTGDTSSGTKLTPTSNGALQIADVNNDGYLDLFLSGFEKQLSDINSYSQHIYYNNKKSSPISFSENAGDEVGEDELRTQNSTPTNAGLYDWDGDGYYDLLVSGRSELYGAQVGFLYTYDAEAGAMRKTCMIPGGSGSTVAFIDWNDDGIKDYFYSGYSGDGFFFGDCTGTQSAVVLNDKASQRPESPTVNPAAYANGKLMLSWTPAPGAAQNTTYEYYVKDDNGNLLTSCLSHIGGDMDGYRKANLLGNAGCNHQVTLSLPEGDYTYGVQAINASYQGSRFAVGSVSTGISVNTLPDAGHYELYDLSGRRVEKAAKGVFIKKSANGVCRKIIAK